MPACRPTILAVISLAWPLSPVAGAEARGQPATRPVASAAGTDVLATGTLRPAFDHLGNVGAQAPAATAAGCTVVYATGIGAVSYSGLPPRPQMDALLAECASYNRDARARGARIVLSYLCATSIVNVETFAANWDDYFPDRPAGFSPGQMLQQDIRGNTLSSWYGGRYAPADMWNPHWRAYTRRTIALAVESGHDGVFFDNPTVHPEGNCSPFAMQAWARFLRDHGAGAPSDQLGVLRGLTRTQPDLWRRFRTTEAADFLRDMREYGRSLSPGFVLTANNSLNAWDSFYSQPRQYAYSILEQSRGQDLVTIEDMGSQPRRQGGEWVSYAGTLRLIHAVGNGRPLSICATDGDYISPPALTRLAIAECTAHDAAYMVWSCWDAPLRAAFSAAIARYHAFLDEHPDLFAGSRPVTDLLLVWPYENWLRREDCPTARLARLLSARNVQYQAVREEELTPDRLRLAPAAAWSADEGLARPATPVLLDAYRRGGGTVLPLRMDASQSQPAGDLRRVDEVLGAARVAIENGPSVRAVVRRAADGRLVLHLYNLEVSRIDTWHDRILPAENLRVSWLLPGKPVNRPGLVILSPDEDARPHPVSCTAEPVSGHTRLTFTVPKLSIWAVVVSETPAGPRN
jgi:hypothetical protein